MLPHNDAESALSAAARVRLAVGERSMDPPQGPVNVTISVGGSVGAGDQNPTTKQMIQAADTALYRAKDSGRDRVELARPEDYRLLQYHG